MSDAEIEFAIDRTIAAPRALVFKLFSQADHLARWWGPAGWEWVSGDIDFRPGGHFHYCMRMPGAPPLWGLFTYEEIAEPERIVFINGFSNAEGGLTHHPMAPTWPLRVRNVLTLEAVEGQTRLTLRGRPHDASTIEQQTFAAGFESMRQGFGGTFNQLDAYVAKLAAEVGPDTGSKSGH